jgi:hypothetical protein
MIDDHLFFAELQKAINRSANLDVVKQINHRLPILSPDIKFPRRDYRGSDIDKLTLIRVKNGFLKNKFFGEILNNKKQYLDYLLIL